jgi:hypothetical protein
MATLEFHEVSLALGLFRVAIPVDWVVEDDFPFRTVFRLPDGGTVTMEAIVREDPALAARDDYASLFEDIVEADARPRLREAMKLWSATPDRPSITTSAHGAADDGRFFRNVWRSLDAAAPRYRLVTWRYEPGSTADGTALARYADALHDRFTNIAFADGETPLDLVAPTPELELSYFGNGIAMRLPIGWTRKRENDDGTGRHVIDEPVHDRWSLWVDWEYFLNPGGDEPNLALAGLVAGLRGEKSETKAAQGDTVIEQRFTAEEDDGPIRVVAWHRFGLRGSNIVAAHFSFVVDARVAELPELVAVRDLVGREALRAAVMICRDPR